MADSRRINANIREEDEKRPVEEQPPFGVYAVILSSEFWPPFKEEKLEVPEDIREALDVYCKKYEKLKVLPASVRWGCFPTWRPCPTNVRPGARPGGARLGEVCLRRPLLLPPCVCGGARGCSPGSAPRPFPLRSLHVRHRPLSLGCVFHGLYSGLRARAPGRHFPGRLRLCLLCVPAPGSLHIALHVSDLHIAV